MKVVFIKYNKIKKIKVNIKNNSKIHNKSHFCNNFRNFKIIF